MKNEYLFPFGRVPQGSRILIYGAGTIGRAFLRQVLMTDYCTVVGMVDKQATFYEDLVVPVISPDQIHGQTFDKIVLAVKSAKTRMVFRSILAEQGVREECIVEWEEQDVFIHRALRTEERTKNLLIYDSGGMGDRIIHKKIVETMLALDADVEVDIYGEFMTGFLEYLYQDTPQVHVFGRNFGAFEARKTLYQAAVFFMATTMTRVEELKRPSLLSPSLFSCLERMQEQMERGDYGEQYPAFTFYQRCRYLGVNCYQHAGADVMPIDDKPVAIPLDTEGRKSFEEMKLGAYITLNCGTGDMTGISHVAKSWPPKRFEALIALLHEAYPSIEIVQLGAKNAKLLAGTDHCVFGEPYGFVREILSHSLLHIDIEGGLVHFATQLGTKCLVLFGPTEVEFFGYPQNINLTAGGCHGCYFVYPKNYNCCARNMKEPECMYSITPEMVMREVRKYLNFLEA